MADAPFPHLSTFTAAGSEFKMTANGGGRCMGTRNWHQAKGAPMTVFGVFDAKPGVNGGSGLPFTMGKPTVHNQPVAVPLGKKNIRVSCVLTSWRFKSLSPLVVCCSIR